MLLALLTTVIAQLPDGGMPPRGLSCLPTWYAGEVVYEEDGGWGLELQDGGFIAWAHQPGEPVEADGGSLVTTLSDVYRVPYVSGVIVPVPTSDAGIDDPGRERVELLMRATYGNDEDEVMEHLARVRFFGLRWPFHELAAPALERVVGRLQPLIKKNPKLLPFLRDIGGTFIWRRIARSKNLSTHSWAIAIDINTDKAHYWRWATPREPIVWANKIPQEIVDAFEAEGFIWGGRWLHYDTMHFEYRPELLSPECKEK